MLSGSGGVLRTKFSVISALYQSSHIIHHINAENISFLIAPNLSSYNIVRSYSIYVLPYTTFANMFLACLLVTLTLTVRVATIDAQWEGMGDVGSARYEPALLPPCPTIRVLSYSN